ncbi:hypothetical protein [Aeribacillus pallidus]|uniref:Uncharacterized protein n=1 Tax=Aeribacillus pallidus TaxID=33936 RepID=A0A223E7H2_9BACI|nr:hypothetical protein [Aeribacillus pallidus]ASS91192.1 hypothetical protein AP3564_14075 [Aeribacillus pallidus]
MASVASRLKVGPGIKKDTQISALVSAKPYETVRDYLETYRCERTYDHRPRRNFRTSGCRHAVDGKEQIADVMKRANDIING